MNDAWGYHWSRCGGGAGGGGKVVLVGGGVLTGILALEWVAAHAWEVLTVTALCGVGAVTAVVALMRWGDRREQRHMAERPFLTSRAEPATLTATVIPQVSQPERPAIPQVVNFNFYGADATQAAAIMRQAIPVPGVGKEG